ncbi:hypothetical protein [Methylocapsa palsarum]|uniref:Uncharacterized protein n=1 Tax=Methylocapsa palsarum TaxID=1612308 RepID=A0A1I4AUV1_9HYPH|nr:hypothetical protein [Methylocapsa palsarum]SFK59416.1 hypothetical protein SAMN05444581_111102 [Methylocapsa palsarum]
MAQPTESLPDDLASLKAMLLAERPQTPIIGNLTPPASLCIVEGGDHSFKVPKKAAASQERVNNFVIDEIERWLRNTAT